ncbi:hypothetical protein AMAG_12398 [Allomyces macrogynus ATCC 38327]|uniref:Potassium uptake protein n=1 Tax=Allomyces macrogynus (strain ATCC 38327) TaxID=578462 RepID=A0A0L0SYS4_ALLM3|nr:hypothetical protein AMAG_12398 [Allomyces macrogynus ATCC 38327]|eukprot:KNE67662.1 hypothetical protein AMAG_12398 [Allomyces macrogynus ATCC 38327]
MASSKRASGESVATSNSLPALHLSTGSSSGALGSTNPPVLPPATQDAFRAAAHSRADTNSHARIAPSLQVITDDAAAAGPPALRARAGSLEAGMNAGPGPHGKLAATYMTALPAAPARPPSPDPPLADLTASPPRLVLATPHDPLASSVRAASMLLAQETPLPLGSATSIQLAGGAILTRKKSITIIAHASRGELAHAGSNASLAYVPLPGSLPVSPVSPTVPSWLSPSVPLSAPASRRGSAATDTASMSVPGSRRGSALSSPVDASGSSRPVSRRASALQSLVMGGEGDEPWRTAGIAALSRDRLPTVPSVASSSSRENSIVDPLLASNGPDTSWNPSPPSPDPNPSTARAGDDAPSPLVGSPQYLAVGAPTNSGPTMVNGADAIRMESAPVLPSIAVQGATSDLAVATATPPPSQAHEPTWVPMTPAPALPPRSSSDREPRRTLGTTGSGSSATPVSTISAHAALNMEDTGGIRPRTAAMTSVTSHLLGNMMRKSGFMKPSPSGARDEGLSRTNTNASTSSYLSSLRRPGAEGKPGAPPPPPMGRPARRMSLGAALMMPPAPRVQDKMDVKTLLAVTFKALGILYGDVAAAPMFVMKSVFKDGVNQTDPVTDILGCLSLMIWISIILGIVKYCLVVLKAENSGEGGILALLSLVPTAEDDSTPPFLVRHYRKIFLLALCGCAFLLGDGLVTPAISILAAVEGFHVIEDKYPDLFHTIPVDSWRVPATCVLLIMLFYVQRFGLGRITAIFPVVMVVWFSALAVIGIWNIIQMPAILLASNPLCMVRVMVLRGWDGTLSMLSTVLLVVAGLEFLYADLGTFKRRPITLSFSAVVVPCTLIAYLGQGAKLLSLGVDKLSSSDPATATAVQKVIHNLFFEMVPTWSLWPLVLLGTLVSAVGSQAVICGCFAMIDQAITLRVFPSFESVHLMGADGHGSYYVPFFNGILLVGSLALAGAYQDSDVLSDMFGLCVAGAMLITSILMIIVMVVKWSLPWWRVALYGIVILVLDAMLFIASLIKLGKNAWITFLFSATFFGIMFIMTSTWTDIFHAMDAKFWTMTNVRQHIRIHGRVKGMGVFVAYADEEVPHVLSLLAARLPALPEEIILLTTNCVKALPFVAEDDRVICRAVDPAHGVYRLLISHGFAERPMNVQEALQFAKKRRGLKIKTPQDGQPGALVTFFVARHSVLALPDRAWYRRWKHYLYEVISRNTNNQVHVLGLPVQHVLEVSNVLEL